MAKRPAAEKPKVDVNNAEKKELLKLNGMTDDIADLIIYRRNLKPFASLDEVLCMPNIGPTSARKLEKSGLAVETGPDDYIQVATKIAQEAAAGFKGFEKMGPPQFPWGGGFRPPFNLLGFWCNILCNAGCGGGCAAGCVAGCAAGCQADSPIPGPADVIAAASAGAAAAAAAAAAATAAASD